MTIPCSIFLSHLSLFGWGMWKKYNQSKVWRFFSKGLYPYQSSKGVWTFTAFVGGLCKTNTTVFVATAQNFFGEALSGATYTLTSPWWSYYSFTYFILMGSRWSNNLIPYSINFTNVFQLICSVLKSIILFENL